MAKKTGGDYKSFVSALVSGQVGRFYIFHGDEKYLLERSVSELRRVICPDGLDGFSYKRFDGAISPGELEDAIDTLPAFAERTLVELHDFDLFKTGEDIKKQFASILSDLPDYVCVVLIYDTVIYKPDGRQKLNSSIIKNAEVVEFTVQEQNKLIKWIKRHFHDAGKRISDSDAEHLAFITGGYMSALCTEIEKTAAYATGEVVTREDIDAVVTPTLDAVAYKLTDALAGGNYPAAMVLLDELLRMREAPHKLMFGISLKLRQLMAARMCIENGAGADTLMEICGIRYSFQARALMDAARKTTLLQCRNAVLLCSETAYELNSRPEPEARLTELITKLAFSGKGGKC